MQIVKYCYILELWKEVKKYAFQNSTIQKYSVKNILAIWLHRLQDYSVWSKRKYYLWPCLIRYGNFNSSWNKFLYYSYFFLTIAYYRTLIVCRIISCQIFNHNTKIINLCRKPCSDQSSSQLCSELHKRCSQPYSQPCCLSFFIFCNIKTTLKWLD